MNTKLPLLALLVFINTSLIAQYHPVRYYGAELAGGASRYGWVVQAGGYNYLTNAFCVRLNVWYNSEVFRSIPHKATGGNLLFSYALGSDNFHVSPLVGLAVSSEQDFQNYSFQLLKYGGVAGVELEQSLSPRFSVFGNYQQYRFLPSNTNVTTSYTGADGAELNNVWGIHRWAFTLGLRLRFEKASGSSRNRHYRSGKYKPRYRSKNRHAPKGR